MKRLLKNIYSLIPFKPFFFGILKKIVTPTFYQHLHFQGSFQVKIDAQHQFKMYHYGSSFENEIFWKGLEAGWEPQSVKIWAKLCKQSQMILDIGANTGVYALIAKAMQPNATVIAFEPLPRIYEKLQKNITLNSFHIKAECLAVANQEGTTTFYDLPHEYLRQATLNPNLHANETTIPTQVNCVRMKNYISQQFSNYPAIDLMKIDVESYEAEVLKGFDDYLAQHQPTILLEILNEQVAEEVHTILEKCGYRYFYNIDEEKGLSLKPKIVLSNYRNYLITNHKL